MISKPESIDEIEDSLFKDLYSNEWTLSADYIEISIDNHNSIREWYYSEMRKELIDFISDLNYHISN